MKLLQLLFSLLLTLLIPSTELFATVATQNLGGEWKFKQAGKVTWHNATVPGTVHTDLMANNMIPDPFIGQNEQSVQWVDKADWIYEKTFNLDSTIIGKSHINLVFNGLDTYADVYLNDSLILKTNNMFRRWDAPVAGLLKPDNNVLKVFFHSPIKVDMPKFDALPFQYECGNDQSENGGILNKRVSIFARKAGYHYGWDWGPRLVTSGIWRPVFLEAWNDFKIEDIYFRTLSIEKNKASMLSSVEIYSDTTAKNALITISDGKQQFAKKTVDLQKGLNTISLPFTVKNPRLWWSNGLGEPNLYDFKTNVVVNNKTVCSQTKQTGIRKIEVVRDEDEQGKSFYFKLNGLPVFAKGANYIPNDNFLTRVTPEIYKKVVKDAADANMNMLRIWGGGIYEDPYFYQLCDSLGIMVWQDFMFACSLYPAEGEMLDNIQQEAIDNVKRLRNHPSIAIWCGNNECLEAWYNWGWKRRYERKGYADVVWKQFKDLYFDLLPEVVADLSPDTPYTPSSPFSREDGSPEPNRGDFHLWTVWGGGQPIDTYNHTRSRFFSEYGFQSFPEFETVIKYAPDSTQHFIDSDVMLAHQRAGADANRKIEKYLLQSYPEPKDFKSFLYMSQILQGDAIKTAIEAHRRDMPYCMGSLFWQHNDCWPVASWSSRDYYGNWKAQHYFAKKAYRDIMLSSLSSGDSIQLSLVSDRLKSTNGTLNVTVRNMKGDILKSERLTVKIPSQGVEKIFFPKKDLFGDNNLASLYVDFLLDTNTENYSIIFFPLPQKEMKFLKPEIKIDITGSDGNYTVNVSSDVFVRAFRMTIPDEKAFFDDNYFDIIPGKTYSVKLKSDLPLKEIADKIAWTSLYNATH